MSSFVLDCSVAMSWCFEDEKSDYGDYVLLNLRKGASAIVSSIFYIEVTNLLLMAERKRRISAENAIYFLSQLEKLPINVDDAPNPKLVLEIFHIGREHKLKSYDTSYLSLCLFKGLPIATLDQQLLKVAILLGFKKY